MTMALGNVVPIGAPHRAHCIFVRKSATNNTPRAQGASGGSSTSVNMLVSSVEIVGMDGQVQQVYFAVPEWVKVRRRGERHGAYEMIVPSNDCALGSHARAPHLIP